MFFLNNEKVCAIEFRMLWYIYNFATFNEILNFCKIKYFSVNFYHNFYFWLKFTDLTIDPDRFLQNFDYWA